MEIKKKKRHGKSGRSHARRSKPGTVNRDINPANILLPIQKWGKKKFHISNQTKQIKGEKKNEEKAHLLIGGPPFTPRLFSHLKRLALAPLYLFAFVMGRFCVCVVICACASSSGAAGDSPSPTMRMWGFSLFKNSQRGEKEKGDEPIERS